MMDDCFDDPECGFDDEEDDLLLAGIADEALNLDEVDYGYAAGPSDGGGEVAADISFGIGDAALSTQQNPDASGFDWAAGKLWIYPTNYPVRDYQYNIVQQALYRNTLVVLPTGLGKTFIAAVVMYNLYRWFPQGKVVFMAPTKPLVAQQINACYSIVGIPKEDTIEMTGNMNPVERERMWRQKRVIFLTPQVMTNDLSRGSFSASSIKCLVVDEAHKAVGNHAYCQVVQGLLNFTQGFRVLALSATPGSDLKGVQQVMCNLLISHIELRSEESIDIRPYTHERKVDKVVVPMGEELSGMRLKYIQVMEMVVNRLIKQRVLFNRDASKLSKFLILKARAEYRQNPPSHIQGAQCGSVEADFATAMSLYHGFELLQRHGLRSLYNFLLGIQSGDKGYGRTRYELCRNPDFIEIIEQLQQKFSWKAQHGPGQDKDAKMAVGHPKMQRLEEIVVEHFKSFQRNGMDTRVMIFSQYRDSVEEIRNILNQHQPLVKVMMFIGQSSVGKATKGYTQKEQLEVMRQFREGGYNTLVSTCVGEEGLDIGDVDLIVCFDAHKSPIRLVQRMGRTGRKRMGRIVMLVTKGKEEQIYNQSLYSKKSIHKAIMNGAKTLHFYPHNPPMIPPGVKPQCHKMHITVKPPNTDSKKKGKKSVAGKARPMENGGSIVAALGKARSKQSSSHLSNSEYEEIKKDFCQISKSAKHLPRPQCTILSKDRESADDQKDQAAINLSEWTPWQNRLQKTHFVGHSSSTHNLVQTCEFIELQQSIGEDANSYGLEMRLYLNKADVLNSSSLNQSVANVSGQSSIKSFFSPSQGLKQGNSSPRTNCEMNRVGISKKAVGTGKDVSEKSKKTKKKRAKHIVLESSSNNVARSVSNSSALFTSILPVTEQPADDDFDIEIINHDTSHGKNVEPKQDKNSAEKVSVRKKKANKKKLLNKNDAVWRGNDSNGDTKNCQSKERTLFSNISFSNSVLQSVGQDEGTNGGVDKEYVFHTSVDRENLFRTSSRSNVDQSQSRSFKELYEEKKCNFHEAIEIEGPEQILLVEKSDDDIDSPKKDCNTLCMFPSPPRVEEVVELFETLESPIDFASIDLYQMVDGWEKFGTQTKCFNGSKVSSFSKSAFVENDLSMSKDVSRVNTSVHSVIKVKVGNNVSLSSNRTQQSGHCEGDHETLLEEGSAMNVTENDVCVSKGKQEDICYFERGLDDDDDDDDDDVYKALYDDIYEISFSRNKKSNISKMNANSRASCPSISSDEVNKEPQQPKEVNIISKLPLTFDDNKMPREEAEDCILSPPCFSDSMNDIMGAMEIDERLLSPSSVKKSMSKGKLEDTWMQNTSSANVSLATFSLALGCCHSSSSDNFMSPPHSGSIKDSSMVSPLGGKRFDLSCTKQFTNLKSTQKSFSISSIVNDKFQPENLAPDPKMENRVQDKDKSDPETEHNLNSSTSNKLGNNSDLDEFGCDDEWFASDIIPATPTKNNSGKSTITLGINNSQVSPSSLAGFRKSSSRLHQNQVYNKQTPPTTTAPDRSTNTSSKKRLNPLQHVENTRVRRERKQSYSLNRLSQILSSNEENVPTAPSQCDKTDDKNHPTVDDEDDCIIVSPVTKNQNLPFAFHDNTECIEILDSQPPPPPPQQLPLHHQKRQPPPSPNPSPPNLSPPLHSGFSPHPTLLNTPTTSRSATKSFLSSTKKKRLSLKSGDDNSFNEEYPTTKSSLKRRARDGNMDSRISSRLKPGVCGISASTPLSKSLSAILLGGGGGGGGGGNDEDGGDRAMLAMDHLTPIKGLPSTPHDEGDVEESFVIRRKRKPTAVLDSSSDSESSGGKKRSSWLCARSKWDQNESKDSKKDRSKSLEDWQAACLEDAGDDDDFEEMEPVFSKGKRSPATRRGQKEAKVKPMRRLKKTGGFVEQEADVSGEEASSDECEGDGDDYYEDSFINNDTEMAPTQADSTDMRAVYLKSVRSPIRGKYKLQFDPARNTNIFSQAMPASQGLSEYEEDSFCVGSEEEEEDLPSPVKKPKKKSHKGRNDAEKRRVVRMVSDSSSENDDDNRFPFTQEVTTNQRALAQKALMSSSSEDEEGQNGVQHGKEQTGLPIKNGRRASNLLDSTNDDSDCNFTTTKHLSTSSNVVSNKNQCNHNKNLDNSISTSPVSEVGSHSTTKHESASKNVTVTVKAVDISNTDELMNNNDFDAGDINFDYDASWNQRNEEETQAPKHMEGMESSRTRSIGETEALGDTEGLSKNFAVRTSSTNYGSESRSTFAYPGRPSNVAFVKPLGGNDEVSTVYNVSNNEDRHTFLRPKNTTSQTVAVSRDSAREERLKRQKEKQERFRQKLAHAQKQQQQQQQQQQQPHPEETSYVSSAISTESSPRKRKPSTSPHALPSLLSPSTTHVSHPSPAGATTTTHTPPSTSFKTSPANSSNLSVNTFAPEAVGEALHVLVDTREISGAQDVITALRLKHSITVTAKQLSSCDYALSNHLVVDRMFSSAFSNGSNRSRLTARLCEMQTLYRKCVIIIEADKVKTKTGQLGKHQAKCTVPHSKYTDKTMACLIQTGVKIYFTDSADQTASLLSELCQAERRKGRQLTVPVKLNPRKEGMYNFVMAIPQVNIMEALNLVHSYSNLADLVSSPTSVLQKKGCLSLEKVQWIHNYIRHRFDPKLLPSTYR